MNDIEYVLTRGVDTIYPSREALEKVLRSGKKLRLYQGFDPTGPQLHIGHAVALRKLRQFQDLGHQVIFLIGDFTAMIGDPSGKYSERKVLTREEVMENAKSYKEQAGRIIRFEGENPVEIKYNSQWLSKMSAIEFIQLSHLLSVQQVIERDMFQVRLKRGQDLFLNEVLYPVLQAFDSVSMNVDLEIGGEDQMFNMMMGRKLMRKMKGKEKFVITVPLLTDAAGIKIGKTENNVIGLTDPPNDFYGKIMSLGDDAIIPCFTLLTDLPLGELEAMQNAMKAGENPMLFKKRLAFELTKQFNDEEAAQLAQQAFERVYQQGQLSDSHISIYETKQKDWNPVDLLVAAGLAVSKSEARRLIEQKAVELNGTVVTNQLLTISDGAILKVGKKKFIKIQLTEFP